MNDPRGPERAQDRRGAAEGTWTAIVLLTCAAAALGLVLHLQWINTPLARQARELREQSSGRDSALREVMADVARKLPRLKRKMQFVGEGIVETPARPSEAEIEASIESVLESGYGRSVGGRPWWTANGTQAAVAHRLREFTVVSTWDACCDVLDDLEWLRVAPRIDELEIRSLPTGLSGVVSMHLRLSFEPRAPGASTPPVLDQAAPANAATDAGADAERK